MVKTAVPMQRVRFLTLIRELRSHMPRGVVKKKKKIAQHGKNNIILFATSGAETSILCVCDSCSVTRSLRSHRPSPTRLFRPWNSPGMNTGVSCQSLLYKTSIFACRLNKLDTYFIPRAKVKSK